MSHVRRHDTDVSAVDDLREEETGMRSMATARASGTARRASDSPAARALARAGLTARGVLYILIGWVAILVALGQSSQEADQQGALQLLAGQPYGLVSLWLLGIGFAGYALWRLSEAAFGVTGEGNGAGPRLKSLVRALIYAFFAYLTFKIIAGTGGGSQTKQAAGPDRQGHAPPRRAVAGRHRRPGHRDRWPGARRSRASAASS